MRIALRWLLWGLREALRELRKYPTFVACLALLALALAYVLTHGVVLWGRE